jgi:hypothetical protein
VPREGSQPSVTGQVRNAGAHRGARSPWCNPPPADEDCPFSEPHRARNCQEQLAGAGAGDAGETNNLAAAHSHVDAA